MEIHKEKTIQGSTYVIGDIHGWDAPILELFEMVNFDYENDKLILIGDLCDRGPNTWEVIELLLKVKNLVFVIGNHDYCFKQFLIGNKDYHDWEIGMGKETLASYKSNNWANLDTHKDFLNRTVPYHIENNICFVHGGFDRYKSISTQTETFLCHDRQFVNDMINHKDKLYIEDNFDKVFVGHTPTCCWNIGDEFLGGSYFALSIDNPNYKPIVKHGVYLIDTGCGKDGPLTMYNVYSDKYYQTERKLSKVVGKEVHRIKWK
jgi:serine/threonine protein phosphatase 1